MIMNDMKTTVLLRSIDNQLRSANRSLFLLIFLVLSILLKLLSG